MALPESYESKRCRRNGKQCRPWSVCSFRSSLIWVCTVCLGISVQKLRIITVFSPRRGTATNHEYRLGYATICYTHQLSININIFFSASTHLYCLDIWSDILQPGAFAEVPVQWLLHWPSNPCFAGLILPSFLSRTINLISLILSQVSCKVGRVCVYSGLTLLSTIFQSYHDSVWLRQGAQCSLL